MFLIKKIFPLLFLFFIFFSIFGDKASAACTNPVWTRTGQTNGVTSINFHLTLKSNCSTTANFTLTATLPQSTWTYKYSGCSTNTPCVKSISAYSTIKVDLLISRPLGQTPGFYTVVARAQQSSTVFRTISLSYEARAEQFNCNSTTHQCVAVESGSYTVLSTCQNNCWLYKCDTTNYTCARSATGTLANCSTCVAPACTYTYSAWSACSSSGTQTRTVISSSPANCTGTPVLSRSCTPPTPNCNSGISCGGCSLTTGTCGAGTRACVYTSYTGGGTCKQVAAPNQTCTVGCSNGYDCVGGICKAPACPKGVFSNLAPGGAPSGGLCALNQAIGGGLGILFVAVVVLAIIFLIWGGIDWITSGGDKQKLQSAKHKATFAIVGLIIAFAAYLVVGFLGYFFKVAVPGIPAPASYKYTCKSPNFCSPTSSCTSANGMEKASGTCQTSTSNPQTCCRFTNQPTTKCAAPNFCSPTSSCKSSNGLTTASGSCPSTTANPLTCCRFTNQPTTKCAVPNFCYPTASCTSANDLTKASGTCTQIKDFPTTCCRYIN